MTAQVSERPTKTAHIGRTAFEIPAHMTMADMAECWQGDSEVLDAFVKSIVDSHPRLAFEVVHAYCVKHNQRLMDYDPAQDAKIIERAEAYIKKQRKAGVKFTA